MAKILVIDDDGIVLDALTAFLSHAGHKVSTAADGGNGLLAFKNSLPDLVILDRDMPVMTGSAVLRRMREISKKVPIIILTGYDSPESAAAYMRDGASSFMSKKHGLYTVLTEVDLILGIKKKAPGTAAEKAKAVPASAPAKSQPAPVNPKKPVVVVADDNDAVAEVLVKTVAALGCEVFRAEDGVKAVELVRALKPRLVLLDISMPRKTGVEVLKETAPELPDTGFMMITGNEDEELARDCLKFGAFDYLSKPVSVPALKAILKARLLLKGHKA